MKSSTKCVKSGFTIIELVVVTAIMGIIIVLLMNFMANSLRANARFNAQAALLQEVQLTLDKISREIRLSSTADEHNRWPDAYAPNEDDYSWESNDSTLVLATAALDSSNNIIFADPLHYISSKNNNIYFVNNNTLYNRVLADPVEGNTAKTSCPPNPQDTCPDDRELIHNVTQFSIKYFDNQGDEVEPPNARSVEVALTVKTTKYNQDIQASFKTRTVFRNE